MNKNSGNPKRNPSDQDLQQRSHRVKVQKCAVLRRKDNRTELQPRAYTRKLRQKAHTGELQEEPVRPRPPAKFLLYRAPEVGRQGRHKENGQQQSSSSCQKSRVHGSRH